jgi:heme A synthase
VKEGTLGNTLFMAHSGVRYLVLLSGVIALLLALLALRKGTLSRPGEVAGRVYLGFLDLQFLLGLATVLTRPFVPQYIGHIVLMVLAVSLAHGVSAAVKKRPEGARPPGMLAAAIAGSLALIVVGILSIGRPIV